jgi:hypothetical protein
MRVGVSSISGDAGAALGAGGMTGTAAFTAARSMGKDALLLAAE